MFVCASCSNCSLPHMNSYGRCEVCGEVKECYDCPPWHYTVKIKEDKSHRINPALGKEKEMTIGNGGILPPVTISMYAVSEPPWVQPTPQQPLVPSTVTFGPPSIYDEVKRAIRDMVAAGEIVVMQPKKPKKSRSSRKGKRHG